MLDIFRFNGDATIFGRFSLAVMRGAIVILSVGEDTSSELASFRHGQEP